MASDTPHDPAGVTSHPSNTSATMNHRRPPAHRSVSLLHSPSSNNKRNLPTIEQSTLRDSPPNSANAPRSNRANPPLRSSSTVARVPEHSSGDSSDAGNWFDRKNNEVCHNNSTFANKDDPPFFLRQSSSDATPPERPQDPLIPYTNHALPIRPGSFFNQPTDTSSAEDFRSVIDDLTVENKKLKRKLRKYEKLYDAHLQKDKLFEVRFHGLPPHKKCELEETLRKFAMSVEDAPSLKSASNSGGYSSRCAPSQLEPHPTAASSHTSRFAESGYASMSGSGNMSAAPSGLASAYSKPTNTMSAKEMAKNKKSEIQSFLSNIPAGLMPQQSVAMSDPSKKKLVVRRLEELFAGKGAAISGHQQPMQQEEVAQSAALTDRRAHAAAGRQARNEGLREARIMPQKDPNEMDIEPGTHEAVQDLKDTAYAMEKDPGTGNSSPDQRPTRPLDLDPSRAQVPAENLEYIRHLGFSPPNPGALAEEGHGWIYLNLLMNMAQLHTIHVTPEFVQKAIEDYSSKIELSEDGRKVRWRGSADVTRNSSDSSPNTPHADGQTLETRKRTRKHNDENPQKRARRLARKEEAARSKFTYTPLFYRADSEENSSPMAHSSLSSPAPALDSTGMTSSGLNTHQPRKPPHQDGPIIFYNKANFCTDLSGDQRITGHHITNSSAYSRSTTQPVGTRVDPAEMQEDQKRGPLARVDPETQLRSHGDRASLNIDDFNFSPKSLEPTVSDQTPEVYNFEVSGIGGVEPRDNFAIHVVSRQARIRSPDVGQDLHHRKAQMYPPKFRSILESSGASPVPDTTVAGEIIRTDRKDLPPTSLPPASFLPFDSTSSGDVDSDLESDPSPPLSPDLSSISAKYPIARQPLNLSSSDYSSDDDVGDDDDGNIDLLATARQLDPETVLQKEREYDATMADKSAEEIPAGSSAATAGGGSGFCSPASVLRQNSLEERLQEDEGLGGEVSDDGSMAKRPGGMPGLKRARTSGSSVPQQQQKAQKMEA